MIELHKPDIKLPTLCGEEVGKALLEVEAWLADQTKQEPELKDYWRKPDVMGALLVQQGWCCAYCQSEAEHVDHFRPQRQYKTKKKQYHAGYPWLAYSWDNLLLACEECNLKKGSRFPLSDDRHRATPTSELSKECPLFLNPSTDAVNEVFSIELRVNRPIFDIRTNQGHILKIQAEETLSTLCLNGRRRFQLKKNLEEYLINREYDKEDAVSSFAPFSWVARALTGRTPSEEENLYYFLERVIDLINCLEDYALDDAKEENQTLPQAEVPYTKLPIYRWALAILLYHHPLREVIKAFLCESVSKRTSTKIEEYLFELNQLNTSP